LFSVDVLGVVVVFIAVVGDVAVVVVVVVVGDVVGAVVLVTLAVPLIY